MVSAPIRSASHSPVSHPQTVLSHCDAASLESLISQHADRWFAVARRVLRSEHDAADALQEAYVSALASLHQFRGDSLPSTWVHRIVVNACLMRKRSRKATSALMHERLAAPTEHDRLITDETRQIVHECISRLPRSYRDVLVMRDINEQSTHDTARLLRIEPGAVKTRLHRARRALRTLLEQSACEGHLALGA